ncbi:hypothetical protein SeMB42_g07899 [Synchytrium endobioticum]|uniref:Uncharacterized protein n=1 Tax=Synchytrium endobioticum TaxID=286115 RepID=A0A507BTH2_9FUNG|nr:hypothetical protein SeMB42_g07899 [Synchytrium endobioticum]
MKKQHKSSEQGRCMSNAEYSGDSPAVIGRAWPTTKRDNSGDPAARIGQASTFSGFYCKIQQTRGTPQPPADKQMSKKRNPAGLIHARHSSDPCVSLEQGKKIVHVVKTLHKSWNNGLISADRSNMATLLLTIPSSKFKSSARDLSSPILILLFRVHTLGSSPNAWVTLKFDSGHKSLFLIQLTHGEGNTSSRSSLDSDLEAFSHNPTHGSFTALAFQPTVNTNYANQRFLSY